MVTLTHPTNADTVRHQNVKPAHHRGISSEDCSTTRTELLACTVSRITSGENVDQDRFNLQSLGLSFIRKTPRSVLLSYFLRQSILSCLTTQRSVFTLFREFVSIIVKRGPVRALQRRLLAMPHRNHVQQNFACDPFSHPRDNQPCPLSTGNPPHVPDRVINPWATVLTQCHTVQAKSNHHETHTTTSYPLHPLHVLSSPFPPPAPFQQQRVALAPVPSHSASDFNSVHKGLCGFLVPQKRRESAISTLVASCSVCHVDRRL